MSTDPNATLADAVDSPDLTPVRSVRRRRAQSTLRLNVLTVFLGIALWWLISLTGLQIPSPPAVIRSAIDLAQRGLLLEDIVASLRRVLSGFLLG